MRVVSNDQIRKQLTRQVVDIISGALDALNAGQSTALARSQLREVSRTLEKLEFDYAGGCSW